MNEEYEVITSPLCQPVTRDGEKVQIDIFEDGAGGWILEVIDAYNNSTVWDDPFKTDQEALEEAFNVIEKEGIKSLIGNDTGSPV